MGVKGLTEYQKRFIYEALIDAGLFIAAKKLLNFIQSGIYFLSIESECSTPVIGGRSLDDFMRLYYHRYGNYINLNFTKTISKPEPGCWEDAINGG